MQDQRRADPEQQNSLWLTTAAPAPSCQSLDGDTDTQVVVVGAGFTGLACALALAEQGTRVTVLEANEIGHGGSGRNGGQVIPGMKQDPDELVAALGPADAERMIALSGNAADRVFALVDRHRIDCRAEHKGWLQPAHDAKSLRVIHNRARAWEKRGAPVEILDRNRTAGALGTPYYHGAWIDRRAGAVQPLSLARGLARAAMSAGASLHTSSPVNSLARESGKWIASAPRGRVKADALVIATDAYSGELRPELARNIVCLNSVQIATDVLPPELRARIIPIGLPVSETRKLVYYYRLDPEGRFVMGGRGNVAGVVPEHVFAALRMVAERLFPALKGQRWPYRWWGQVGLTMDWVPHLAELAPGLWTGIGYCGRGVAMATAMGQVLANRVLGGALARSDPELDFPVKPLKGVPFWTFRKPGVAAAIAFFRAREALGIPA